MNKYVVHFNEGVKGKLPCSGWRRRFLHSHRQADERR